MSSERRERGVVFGAGFGIGIPVGMLLTAAAVVFASSYEDTGVPGAAVRESIPTPTATPDIFYGHDPLREECLTNKNTIYHDEDIKFSKEPIVIASYPVTVENGEFVAREGASAVRGKEITLRADQGQKNAREYYLALGEQTRIGEAATITEFLTLPSYNSSVIDGKCTPPVTPTPRRGR